MVLLPYEITLFSNICTYHINITNVLLPYEITLFSNKDFPETLLSQVLLPYEITLFSNNRFLINFGVMFYYLMKLHYSQT